MLGWSVADVCVVGLVYRFCGCGGLFGLRDRWCLCGVSVRLLVRVFVYLEFDVSTFLHFWVWIRCGFLIGVIGFGLVAVGGWGFTGTWVVFECLRMVVMFLGFG